MSNNEQWTRGISLTSMLMTMCMGLFFYFGNHAKANDNKTRSDIEKLQANKLDRTVYYDEKKNFATQDQFELLVLSQKSNTNLILTAIKATLKNK